MNPLAAELNEIIKGSNPHIYDMLSEVGKRLFFPKGILTQSAEAREKAYLFNATIGMATEKGDTMYLPSIMNIIQGLSPKDSLTYAPSFGIKELREAWKESLYQKNPSLKGKEISLPVVTNAITHALAVVGDMFVDSGDVLVLPDKMWGNYNMIFSVRRGAKIVNYTLFNENNGFNIEGFNSCLNELSKKYRKIIVVLNFPNNPTGYTISTREADGICEVIAGVAQKGVNIIVFSDDAYFGLFYEEDCLKESIFSRLCGIDERILAIKLDGATKEDYVWGLRVGFITYGVKAKDDISRLYDALERKTAGDVRGSISNASHLSQTIILNAMRSPNYLMEKREKYDIMKGRAEEVKRVLSEPKYNEVWDPYPFNSGYFMCLKLKDIDAENLRKYLLDRYGVGLISLGERDLRVAFSCIEKVDIKRLFDTIYKAALEIKEG